MERSSTHPSLGRLYKRLWKEQGTPNRGFVLACAVTGKEDRSKTRFFPNLKTHEERSARVRTAMALNSAGLAESQDIQEVLLA